MLESWCWCFPAVNSIQWHHWNLYEEHPCGEQRDLALVGFTPKPWYQRRKNIVNSCWYKSSSERDWQNLRVTTTSQMMIPLVGALTPPLHLPLQRPHQSITRGISTASQSIERVHDRLSFRYWWCVYRLFSHDSRNDHLGTPTCLSLLSPKHGICAHLVHHSVPTDYCSSLLTSMKYYWSQIKHASIATFWFACTQVEFLRNGCR